MCSLLSKRFLLSIIIPSTLFICGSSNSSEKKTSEHVPSSARPDQEYLHIQHVDHQPFAFSSAISTSSSKATLTSSSTKLLNVSFMVRVFRGLEANEGFNSERV